MNTNTNYAVAQIITHSQYSGIFESVVGKAADFSERNLIIAGYASQDLELKLNQSIRIPDADLCRPRFLSFDLKKDQSPDFILDFQIDRHSIFKLPSFFIKEDQIKITEKDSETWSYLYELPWNLHAELINIVSLIASINDKNQISGSFLISSSQKLQNIQLSLKLIYVDNTQRTLLAQSLNRDLPPVERNYIIAQHFRFLVKETLQANNKFQGPDISQVTQGFFIHLKDFEKNFQELQFKMNNWEFPIITSNDFKYFQKVSPDLYYYPFDLETSYLVSSLKGQMNFRRYDSRSLRIKTVPGTEVDLYFLCHNAISSTVKTIENPDQGEIKEEYKIGVLRHISPKNIPHYPPHKKDLAKDNLIEDGFEIISDQSKIAEFSESVGILEFDVFFT